MNELSNLPPRPRDAPPVVVASPPRPPRTTPVERLTEPAAVQNRTQVFTLDRTALARAAGNGWPANTLNELEDRLLAGYPLAGDMTAAQLVQARRQAHGKPAVTPLRIVGVPATAAALAALFLAAVWVCATLGLGAGLLMGLVAVLSVLTARQVSAASPPPLVGLRDAVIAHPIPDTPEGAQWRRCVDAATQIRHARILSCSASDVAGLDVARIRVDVDAELAWLSRQVVEMTQVRAAVAGLRAAGQETDVALLEASLAQVVAATTPRADALCAFARHCEQLDVAVALQHRRDAAVLPAERLLDLLAGAGVGSAASDELLELHGDRTAHQAVTATLNELQADVVALEAAVRPSAHRVLES